MDLVIDGGILVVNIIYNVVIVLLNESEIFVENIMEEIEEEDEDYQFFFVIFGGLDLIVVYVDVDVNGNLIGLVIIVIMGVVSIGEFIVILCYELMKDVQGVKDGDIVNVGGEIDIEVNFLVEIQ